MMDGAPGLAGQYLCRRRTAVAAGQELGCCWKTIHTTLSYAPLSLSLSLSFSLSLSLSCRASQQLGRRMGPTFIDIQWRREREAGSHGDKTTTTTANRNGDAAVDNADRFSNLETRSARRRHRRRSCRRCRCHGNSIDDGPFAINPTKKHATSCSSDAPVNPTPPPSLFIS